MKTIFVGIAAYNEPYLNMMLDNCLANAEHPDRVHFGVWSHNNDGMRPDLSMYPNMKIAYLEYDTLLGVGPARLNSLGFYDQEDYYLQVDGHMLFEKDWDTKVINKLEKIRENYPKPLISTYTPWWSTTDGNIKYYKNDSDATSAPMLLDYEGSVREKYPKPKTEYFPWDDLGYKEQHLLSAHFIFTDGSFVTEILPDPLIMFGGEETTTAMRAWTRGYRIFCIKEPIAWHLNKFDGDRYTKDRLWDSRNHGPLYEHYQRKSNLSIQRSKDIMLGKLTGYWGATTLYTLRRYEIESGINFKQLYKDMENYDV